MGDILAVVTNLKTGESKSLTLDDIQRDFDYTANRKTALDIIRKEYADPSYSLRLKA